MKKIDNVLSILNYAHLKWKQCINEVNEKEYNLLNNPNVGDLVFEVSAPYKKDMGFGFLIAIDYNSGNPLYWIADCITEKVIKYSNCEFKKVKGYHISEYGFYLNLEKENNNGQ